MNPVEILFVEDNAGDTLLVFQAVEETAAPVKFHLARDGEQALLMLHDKTFDADLIILDLGLPGLSGYDVLERCGPIEIPVVVFSGSTNPADEKRALELGVREFVQKPPGFEAYKETVRRMIKKWGLPRNGAASVAAT